MTTPEKIIGLRREGERLDEWSAGLRNVIAGKQDELQVVEGLKAANVAALEALKAAVRKAGRTKVTLDDIKRCDTQREVVRFVAEANFGLAHLGEVAELVLDARMSKAEKDSVRSTLHHYVNDSNDFVHIGKSWVWLTDFGPAPTLEEVESNEAAGQEGDGEDAGAAADSEDGAGRERGGEPAPAPAGLQENAA